MSSQQQRLLRLMNTGFRLKILRSPINQATVGAAALRPDSETVMEHVAQWRIERLLATGTVTLDTADLRTAAFVLPRSLGPR